MNDLDLSKSQKFDTANLDVTAFFKACHQCSIDHGWWDDKYSDADDPKLWFGEKLMLSVGECIEASAEERRFYMGDKNKPEGYVVECADIIIRLADICGRLDILSYASYDADRKATYAPSWEPGQHRLFQNLWRDYPFMAFIIPVNVCMESFRRTPDWKLVGLNMLYFLYAESCTLFYNPRSPYAFNQALISKYEYNLSRPYRHGGLKA